MSVENISVSLSRLALAKAIKTPDTGEDESEPWTKSVIFHQSHISPGMRENMMNPQQQQQRRQQHGRHHQRQQQQRSYPSRQQDYHRHSRQLLDQPSNTTRREKSYQNMSRPASTFGLVSQSQLGHEEQRQQETPSPSSNMAQQQQQQRRSPKNQRHLYASSDDDDEEEEEEEDDDASSQSSVPTNQSSQVPPLKDIGHTNLMPTSEQENQPITSSSNMLNKKKKITPVASDDESDDDSIASSNESQDETNQSHRNRHVFNEWTIPLGGEDDDQEDAHMKARRMSTLRQLERGSSVHKRSRSVGAMEKVYTADVAIDNGLLPLNPMQSEQQENGGIEEWRQTVLDAVDSIGTTPASTPALNINSTASSSPSSFIGSESSRTPSNQDSSSTPARPVSGTRGRRTTLGEMDMMYYMQQQQLQMLQQQQMAQMQYQQAAWQVAQQQMMQQQQQQQQHMMMEQYDNHRRHKVKSISAMDMMMQIEQEKEAKSTARRKPKRIDPSKAQIDGLLGKVQEQGKHNISFQQQAATIKDRADRMAGRSTPHYRQQQYSRQSMMIPESRSQTPMMMTNNLSDQYLLQQQQQWRRTQQMTRSESTPGLQQPHIYRQSMALASTPGLISSSSSHLNLPMMTTSRSTGRPTSTMMRPQSSWGNI
ncbi:uncharacterized protein BX664DRAFT_355026 [Halteromyces radiatus]|uniref:uncharacterized protein n=1 Tax=Halteromyces radiatus TaxID=101107 RepID=UPI00221FA78E|nr:uncharacterized protein BX664DRAFT_355026 [Halteromyces radiatus]KAI8099621.1 hypothetical protein BX664DRAFT_355026 [Halteromyces radiatus]